MGPHPRKSQNGCLCVIAQQACTYMFTVLRKGYDFNESIQKGMISAVPNSTLSTVFHQINTNIITNIITDIITTIITTIITNMIKSLRPGRRQLRGQGRGERRGGRR